MSLFDLKTFRRQSGLPAEAIYSLIEGGLLPLVLQGSPSQLMVDTDKLDLAKLAQSLLVAQISNPERTQGSDDIFAKFESELALQIESKLQALLDEALNITSE